MNVPTKSRGATRVGYTTTWLSCCIALALTARPALADGAQVVPAPMPGPTELTQTALIGTSGQVYLYDDTSTTPRWVRRYAGGCTADITGAVVLPTAAPVKGAPVGPQIGANERTLAAGPTAPQILLAGKSAPLFRWSSGAWSTMPVGQKGKTVMGTGPLPSVAIGRQVFVWQGDRMTRVATAPSAVIGVWAATATDVRISTDKALFRLRGKAFVPIALGATKPPFGRIIGGTKPLLIVGSKLVDMERGRSVDVGGVVQLASAATAAGGASASTFAVVLLPSSDASLTLKLVTFAGTAPATSVSIAGPAGATAVTGLLVDRTGRILLTTDTKVWLYKDGAWLAASVESELGPSKTGPGPAFTQ